MSTLFRLLLISLVLPVSGQTADVFVPEQLQGWQRWVFDEKQDQRGWSKLRCTKRLYYIWLQTISGCLWREDQVVQENIFYVNGQIIKN